MRIQLVASVVLIALAGCSHKRHGSNGGGSSSAPTVTATSPVDGASAVANDVDVTASFSVAMDPVTLTTSTFTLTRGALVVPGTVTVAGQTATFSPDGLLANGASYTGTITTGARSLTGEALPSPFVFGFTTSATGSATPSVSSTSPAAGATGVATNSRVVLTFNGPMDPTSVNGTTITLQQGGTGVNGTVTTVGNTAVFTPTGALAPNVPFTITATSGVKDLAGNPLTGFTSTFTTGSAPDSTRPLASSTSPAAGASNVATNQRPSVSFSEALDPTTVNGASFTLTQGGSAVPGTVVYAGTTATFRPSALLAANTVFTGSVSTAVQDLAGNALETPFSWTFTTGSSTDTTAPTVVLTSPANLATGVATNTRAGATFSEAMDPTTITNASFTLKGPNATVVAGTVGYDAASRIATFTPSNTIAANTSFTATVSPKAKDLAGNPLATSFSWSFTTGAVAAQGQNGLVLGAANNFAVLAGSTVTNTGLTKITGDVGLSPGSAVTGFPPGVVNGSIRVNDPAANKAKLDLTAAYNDAAGRSTAPIAVSGNLGGLTLAPGLYKSTGSLAISSGDLTLDAKGDSSAVFIFQVASTLDTTGGRQVILAGGAKAANVYWQVGTSATIGTSSVFKGNVLADQSVSLLTGASLEGRALTSTGAVTLDSSTVTLPAP